MFKIYEPQGVYNGARYISFKVTEDNTILRETADCEIPNDKRGGIITLPSDCNALELGENKFANLIKQFINSWQQRLTSAEQTDQIAQRHNLIGWTIGRFLRGRYTGRNGKVWDEHSVTIEVVGLTTDELIAIAEDLCSEIHQECAFLKDYNTGKIMFFDSYSTGYKFMELCLNGGFKKRAHYDNTSENDIGVNVLPNKGDNV